jgi:hypothetical protein
MLMYPGEGHGLQKKENQIDYERRILQWFGHYLKGEPAADWIVNGQSRAGAPGHPRCEQGREQMS